MSNLVLGIIGGGQLGSMLAKAAKKMNVETVIFCDDFESPAKKFADKFIFGNYKDKNIIDNFINKVNVVTFEFENIPFETLEYINSIKPVYPNPSVNKILQNRLYEKNFVNKLNIKTTQYAFVKKKEDINLNSILLPGLLKTVTLGYDGKGQYKLNSIDEINNININFDKKYILEKFVNLKKEISVIITRFENNKYEIYEPIENEHEHQILKNSKIPADIDDNIKEKSKEWAQIIAAELNYIGTLCVEYFVDKDNHLYVNEIAPRVHNSGHLTINAFNVSQFENHVRAVCKLEQIKLKKISNAEMINILGDQIVKYRKKKFNYNEFFFDYMKKEIKLKRKMGHLTTLKN
jgi:5-(carboxyamino)imidazole ribonucleotide synthase